MREKLHEIIFEADTSAGKFFDVLLLWAIVLSLLAVTLETVSEINSFCGDFLRKLEWFFTILFTIEYLLRIYSIKKPLNYIFSFFGIIDFLALVPTYLSLFFTGTHYLIVIRAIRLLRVFRVFKLARYIGEAKVLMTALKSSRAKITVFLFAVSTIVIIIGAVMYVVEGPSSGYTSIPKAMYWAIVTLTTVGYGDITPQTPLGQALSAFVMILGYGVIAVPTGIVSVELSKAQDAQISTQACMVCSRGGHDYGAVYCKFCGAKL